MKENTNTKISKQDKITTIFEIIEENNVSNYEISKNTGISEAGLGSITNKEVKNPRELTVNAIYDYLTSKYKGETVITQTNGNVVIGNNNKAINRGGKEKLSDSNVEPIYVNLLPVSAQGGSLSDFSVSVKDNECERIISPIKGADFAITVSGDSMFPEYPSGSQILIKKINENAFIDWGKTYVLDTCNGVVIKRVFPSDKDENKLKCISINTEYPPFEVSRDDIFGMYRVLMCMAMK